jgi:hypothetical protein
MSNDSETTYEPCYNRGFIGRAYPARPADSK